MEWWGPGRMAQRENRLTTPKGSVPQSAGARGGGCGGHTVGDPAPAPAPDRRQRRPRGHRPRRLARLHHAIGRAVRIFVHRRLPSSPTCQSRPTTPCLGRCSPSPSKTQPPSAPPSSGAGSSPPRLSYAGSSPASPTMRKRGRTHGPLPAGSHSRCRHVSQPGSTSRRGISDRRATARVGLSAGQPWAGDARDGWPG